ncbi:4-fold beta flower protein [Thermus filiformis]|uniref:4-fold beta flower domain-containing protein n=1 Tax=Thermus filiformis TaxID=276 RepID=A0A0A2WR85_THEFI|nr:hypothetical protein [Thermus filiformis]KGQ22651.2 hypothetical protein THFILI_08235 [Thermus filiformis]
MRRVLYDKTGLPRLLLTGSGVVYDLRGRPLAQVVEGNVVGYAGGRLGFFREDLLLDKEGRILAFVKGKPLPFLPRPLPLRSPLPALRPAPLPPPVPLMPLPPVRLEWSPLDLEAALGGEG